jgi:N6-adenosine-specific RNA methylase IME4
MTLFAPLPTVPGGFRAACPDPPWGFKSNSDARPGRNARRHYRCLTPAEIATLPLGDVMARDSYLFLWVTGPHLAIGTHLEVMRAWGFTPTAMGFTWIKLQRRFAPQPSLFWSSNDLFFGPGLTLRRNAEFMVLGRRGKPERLAKDVFEVIVAPVGARHSEKPDEAYDRIRRYCRRSLSRAICPRAAQWLDVLGVTSSPTSSASKPSSVPPKQSGATSTSAC